MGLHAVPTTTRALRRCPLSPNAGSAHEGQGLRIAFSALDSGRLGIAAVATSGSPRPHWTTR